MKTNKLSNTFVAFILVLVCSLFVVACSGSLKDADIVGKYETTKLEYISDGVVMETYTKEQIDTIRAKNPDDRSAEENAVLFMFGDSFVRYEMTAGHKMMHLERNAELAIWGIKYGKLTLTPTDEDGGKTSAEYVDGKIIITSSYTEDGQTLTTKTTLEKISTSLVTSE